MAIGYVQGKGLMREGGIETVEERGVVLIKG